MLAFIRSIYGLLLKRESVAAQYIRKHPRRIGILSLDAILTIALVSGAFIFSSASSKNQTSQALMRASAVALSYSEFVENVSSNGGRTYWLGDISGFDIVHDGRIDERRSISYVKKGSDPTDLNRAMITVVTYRASANINGLRQLETWSAPYTSVTPSGLMVEYDLNSMMGEIVSMNGTSDTVYVHYSTAQDLHVLLTNADVLRLVA